jgi:hypothetical protein
MAKRRVESQIASLTIDQKNSRIDLIYLVADNVRHTVGKLSMRAITLLQNAPRFEVCSQSYGGSKVAGVPAGAISGLPFGSLGREKPFGCRPRGKVQSIL